MSDNLDSSQISFCDETISAFSQSSLVISWDIKDIEDFCEPILEASSEGISSLFPVSSTVLGGLSSLCANEQDKTNNDGSSSVSEKSAIDESSSNEASLTFNCTQDTTINYGYSDSSQDSIYLTANEEKTF